MAQKRYSLFFIAGFYVSCIPRHFSSVYSEANEEKLKQNYTGAFIGLIRNSTASPKQVKIL